MKELQSMNDKLTVDVNNLTQRLIKIQLVAGVIMTVLAIVIVWLAV